MSTWRYMCTRGQGHSLIFIWGHSEWNWISGERYRTIGPPVYVYMLLICISVCNIFQADNLVFKDRKLNIGPAIRKQVCLYFTAVSQSLEFVHTGNQNIWVYSKILNVLFHCNKLNRHHSNLCSWECLHNGYNLRLLNLGII